MARRRKGQGQTALVTGASGGIGEELAKQFAADGYDLVLVARSADKLTTLARAWEAAYGVKVRTYAFDLGDAASSEKLITQLSADRVQVDVLVNNAGFGAIGAFADLQRAEQLGMVDLNVRMLTDLTRRFLPDMISRGRGGVLNVASVAAFQPGPFMAVYYASKAYVLSLSEALSEELRGTGVTVTALCPGPVPTGFQDRAKMNGFRLMKSVPLMSAAATAKAGYRAFQRGKRVKVAGAVNRLMTLLSPLTPRPILLRIARKLQSERI